MIDKGIEMLGKVADAVKTIWEQILQPFIEWLIENNIGPRFAEATTLAAEVLFAFGNIVSEVIGMIFDTISWFADYIMNVFAGDWQLTWTDVAIFFQGIWTDDIANFLIGIWEQIKLFASEMMITLQDTFTWLWTSIATDTREIWSNVQTFLDTVWSWIKAAASMIFGGIKNDISAAWNAIKTFTSTIWESIKTFLSTLWENVKLTAGTVFTSLKDTISTIWEALKEKTSSIWENIKEGLSTLWENTKSTAENTFNSLKDAVVNVWTALKSKTSEIWNGIWNAIKGVINNIIAGVENMVNRVVTGINTMISGINGLISKIPGVSGGSIPAMGDVSLPRLARGGFVRANTPQLAMIGDNLHQGEVVAPEDKLQEMVDKAVAMAPRNDNGMSEYYLEMMVELLRKIIELIEQMDLTVTIDVREIKKRLEDLDKRSGYKLRTT